jgi:hypothetical protein
MKQLVNSDLTGALEPIYLASELEIMDEDNGQGPQPSDAPVLSTLTDRSTTLAEAKASPDWLHWEQAIRTEVDGTEALEYLYSG